MEAGHQQVKARTQFSIKHFLVLAAALCVSVLSYVKVREFVVHSETQNRLKYLGAAMCFYASDFDDHLPLSENWGSSIRPHLRVDDPSKILRDPFISDENSDLGFGFNKEMAGQSLSKLDYKTPQVLIAQTTNTGPSALVTPETLRVCDRNDGTIWVLPTSTIPRKVKLEEVKKWKWKPVISK